jgi:hypothetical protein
MILEVLCFVVLVSLVGAAAARWVWLKTRKNSSGKAQSTDQDKGRLPDSFFDPRTPESSNQRRDEL